MAKDSLPKAARDNRANQLNPIHSAYYLSRGASPEEAERAAEQARGERDRHDDSAPSATCDRSPSGTADGEAPLDSESHRRRGPESLK